MGLEEVVIFSIEIIGTIAFAISGAMVAIKKGMDILGVCTLGVTTAVGGGMIRDLSLNMVPNSLLNSIYIEVAIVTTIVVFLVVYFRKVESAERYKVIYNSVLMAMDSLGLGLFTALGVLKGINSGYVDNTTFLVFLGTITGVGGGLLRDMMASVRPYIFTKDIYASASIAGAFVFVFMYRAFGEITAMICCTTAVVVIRYLAKHFSWNLPIIKIEEETN